MCWYIDFLKDYKIKITKKVEKDFSRIRFELLTKSDHELYTNDMTTSCWNQICGYPIITGGYAWYRLCNRESRTIDIVTLSRKWTGTWKTIFFKILWTNFSPIVANTIVSAWADIMNAWYFHIKTSNFLFKRKVQLESERQLNLGLI